MGLTLARDAAGDSLRVIWRCCWEVNWWVDPGFPPPFFSSSPSLSKLATHRRAFINALENRFASGGGGGMDSDKSSRNTGHRGTSLSTY
jgi:hypothetical protein